MDQFSPSHPFPVKNDPFTLETGQFSKENTDFNCEGWENDIS